MGNGASSHVKSIKPKRNRGQDTVSGTLRDRRSNSDGFITDTLSSSKSKVDLLQQQLLECQEMLAAAEERVEKGKILEQQIAEVEGQNFELSDKVTSLEEEVQMLRRENEELNQEDFTETVKAKDQYIDQLEKESADMQGEIKKLRIKARKRIKSAQTQLAENKQETALKIYSLKQELSQLEEEKAKLTQRLDRASSATKSRQFSMKTEEAKEEEIDSEYEDSRMKLILELSTQVSQQDEKINQLEEELASKDKTIQELQKLQPRPPSGTRKSSASKVSKETRLGELNRPGSGDTNLNKLRESSGVSRRSVVSRDGVSVDVLPDPDSGIAVDERVSSGSSRDTLDTAAVTDDVSSSRRRRRNKKMEKQVSADCVDVKTSHDNTADGIGGNTYRQNSANTQASGDLASLESESRQGSGGARRKTKTHKDDFSTELDPKGQRSSARSKPHSKPKAKLAANFSSVGDDPYDINDFLNDFDNGETEGGYFEKRSWKKGKAASLSSADPEKTYFDAAIDVDSAQQEISVP